ILYAKNWLLGNYMSKLVPNKWNEPFCLVMVEAMACGTPVLALPGGSVPEIVRDGVSGYVCRSVSQLARRVNSLQTNPINPRDLRQYVQENFSLERMVAGYAALYEETQAGRRAKKIAYPTLTAPSLADAGSR